MKKEIILILILLNTSIVYAISTGDSALGISLSYNNGTNYTTQKSQPWSCNTNDQSKTYGGSTDLWNKAEWNDTELNNNNFIIRLNLTDQVGVLTRMTVDHIKVKIYYTLPNPILTFIPPTPDNNTFIGSTFRINVSSDVTLTECNFESNISGIFINQTMSIDNDTLCSILITGLSNDTHIQYKVHGSSSDGLDWNNTETRLAIVNSYPPNITLISPLNASIDSHYSRLLIFNSTDPENDLTNITITVENSTGTSYNLVYYKTLQRNGTYTYNFSMFPLDNTSENLYALYHLDELINWGESPSYARNFAPLGHDRGEVAPITLINDTGRIGRSYQFEGDGGTTAGIKIGSNYEYNNLCENGCTFSAFILSHKIEISGKGIISRYDTSPLIGFFHLTRDQKGNIDFLISEDKDLNNTCSIIGTGNPVNITNKWYHVIAGFNLTHCYVYVDGTLINSVSTNITPNTTNWNITQDTFIGAYNILLPAVGGVWPGLIDEIAIWNTSLTVHEVKEKYNLSQDTYFWNVNSIDGASITSKKWQFTIGYGPCDYNGIGNFILNCSLCNETIIDNIDLKNNDMIVSDKDDVFINANINNVNRIIGDGCRIYATSGHTWVG